MNLGLIQAATSTFALITQNFFKPKLQKWFLANNSQNNGVRPINVLKLNIKVTITDILVQKLHL